MGVDGVYARETLWTRRWSKPRRFHSGSVSENRSLSLSAGHEPPDARRRCGYLKKFSQPSWCVSCLEGSEAQFMRYRSRRTERMDWCARATDLVLSHDSWLPVYPMAAEVAFVRREASPRRWPRMLPRREPRPTRPHASSDARYVCIGTSDEVADLRRAGDTNHGHRRINCTLLIVIEPASDPFSGAAAMFLATHAGRAELKFEIFDPNPHRCLSNRCMSLNYHRRPFCKVWGLRNSGTREISHTSCAGFRHGAACRAMFAAPRRTRGMPAAVLAGTAAELDGGTTTAMG